MTPMYGLRQYQRTCVQTADMRSAVLCLFDAAIRHTRQAGEALDEKDLPGKCRHIDRALAAVAELAGALDLRYGGALAGRLSGLYNYVMRTLIRANSTNDTIHTASCLAVLRTLREAWEQVLLNRAPAVDHTVPPPQGHHAYRA